MQNIQICAGFERVCRAPDIAPIGGDARLAESAADRTV